MVLFSADNYVMFSRYDERHLEENLLTTSHTYFEFGLRSCQDAVIALGESYENFEYFLRIGADSNANTILEQQASDGRYTCSITAKVQLYTLNKFDQYDLPVHVHKYMFNSFTHPYFYSKTELQQVPTPGIVSCYTTRFFWVSWLNDEFSFGLGQFYP